MSGSKREKIWFVSKWTSVVLTVGSLGYLYLIGAGQETRPETYKLAWGIRGLGLSGISYGILFFYFPDKFIDQGSRRINSLVSAYFWGGICFLIGLIPLGFTFLAET